MNKIFADITMWDKDAGICVLYDLSVFISNVPAYHSLDSLPLALMGEARKKTKGNHEAKAIHECRIITMFPLSNTASINGSNA